MSLISKTSTSTDMVPSFKWNDEVEKIIKNQICKGATENEISAFIYICKSRQLNPMLKQIWFVKRGNSFSTEISIDGFRALAERTGKYCPGREPTYTYDSEGKLVSATAYVKKKIDDQWVEISATAFLEEYKAANAMWTKMPHNQLAKCAESLAIRRAFPQDLSGLHSREEMEHVVDVSESKVDTSTMLDSSQALVLSQLLEGCDEYKSRIFAHYSEKLGRTIENIAQLPSSDYNLILTRAKGYVQNLSKEDGLVLSV